jgi:hypothetical protein
VTGSLLVHNKSLQQRFGGLPRFISHLRESSQLELWHRTVLGCILIRCRTHFHHLSIAYRAPYQLEYLSWAARNLLELAIWAKYVTASKENARKLHSDQVTDLAELQKGMLGLLTKYVPMHPELSTLKEQGEWLRQRKGYLGLEEDGRHLNVGTIAREIGMDALFYGLNGLLSKLVHPTSFSIMLDLNRSSEVQLRESLLALGQGSAEDALRELVAYFDSVGIETVLLRP